MKKEVVQYLENKGFKVSDFGCDSDESCDYPDFAHPMASAVERRANVIWGSLFVVPVMELI